MRDCESERSGQSCERAWQTLDDCYRDSSSSAFVCVGDRSQPGRVCLPERRAVSECLVPGSGSCFDQCVRELDTCGTSLGDCEAACHDPAPGCDRVSHDFYACLATFPTECRPWLEPDPRSPEAVPCYAEALLLLECAK